MKYVSVTAPAKTQYLPNSNNQVKLMGSGQPISSVIFNYFKDYLISFGETATNNGWTVKRQSEHMKHILDSVPDGYNLYVDSGGFQIIMGYVFKYRIVDFIRSYHEELEKSYNRIYRIFSMDVFNQDLSEKEIRQFNTFSVRESIKLIQKYPEIKEKQLFVMQTSNFTTFKIWRHLFLKEKVYEHFKLWSIGGLVGLKKRTNAKFSHAVPATLWLLTYQKYFNFDIEQVHWLGQSSRLSFLAMGLFERIYKINMTSDSSALVRFAPIDQKLPLIHKHGEDFDLAIKVPDIDIMFQNHSLDKEDSIHKHTYDENFCKEKTRENRVVGKKPIKEFYPDEFKTREDYTNHHWKKYERLDDADMTELQSQGIYFEIQFANMICDKIMEIGLDKFKTKEDIMNLHPILKKGRTANELMNNIIFFNRFKDVVSNGDINKADEIMVEVVKGYNKPIISEDFDDTKS